MTKGQCIELGRLYNIDNRILFGYASVNNNESYRISVLMKGEKYPEDKKLKDISNSEVLLQRQMNESGVTTFIHTSLMTRLDSDDPELVKAFLVVFKSLLL